jgi:L-lactate dehydrogenase complex protein LldG
MDTFGQEAFLRAIRSALGHSIQNRRSRDELCSNEFTAAIGKLLDRIKNRSREERYRLLERLIEAAKPINLKILPLKDPPAVSAAVAGFVEKKAPEWGNRKSVVAWKHPLIERLDLTAALADYQVPVYFTALEAAGPEATSAQKKRDRLRRQIVDSYIGVTSADFCMADTATLVMRTRPNQARSVSLVPSIHIAVITLDQIIADLKELYALLRWDQEARKEELTNCMTFICGPSKTADVEATMVHGAHGPREVYIYVITTEGTQLRGT